ncbi:MAG TPA: protein-export chaperone SecB [Burkholderiales bacterium]|jgi:preprotein translocase subunit SecB|nr:protein-export chaperone SecB [Burkholderiales bacterium]
MSAQPEQQFSVEKIYLKDLSLEIPNAPQVFAERDSPRIDISLRNEARPLEAGVFEVVLTSTVTAKVQDRTVFLVEAAQAGIFQLRNVPQAQMEPVLNVLCTSVLFPYLRETISNVVARGGFPPFIMNHVSFEVLYEQRRQQQQQQQQQSQSGGAPPA